VQVPAEQPAALRFALALVAAAAIALLVLAAPASAETAEEVQAVAAELPTESVPAAPSAPPVEPPVEEVTATVTEAASSTATATEAAATEAASSTEAVAAVATDSVDAAVESTSAPSPEVSVPTPASPDVPTTDLSDPVRAAARTPSVRRVARLTDDAVDANQLPDVKAPRGDVLSLATPTSSGIGEDRSPALGSSPEPSHDPAPVGAPRFSLPPLTGPSSLDGETDAPLSPLAKDSGEPGGFEAPSLVTASGRYLAGLASSMVASAARGDSDPAARHLNDPAPLDGPVPLPGAPTAAVSSSGDAFFVPIASLLALLALVAPAIFRRLREVPNFPAPTPFVCALERPG
jgi:hypothetical protein